MNEKITAHPQKEEREKVLKEIQQLENRKKILAVSYTHLDVYKRQYLDDDPLYEVVQTSHGYTLMAWEPHRNDWYSAEIQKTPEDLRNALLDTYANFLEDKITGNDRDLTVTETGEIQQRCRELWEKCRET